MNASGVLKVCKSNESDFGPQTSDFGSRISDFRFVVITFARLFNCFEIDMYLSLALPSNSTGTWLNCDEAIMSRWVIVSSEEDIASTTKRRNAL